MSIPAFHATETRRRRFRLYILSSQVAHFKDRAEELERLQRQTTSSSEAATSFDSVAEADDASHFTAGTLDPVPSLPLSSPGRQEECTEADTQDNNANAEITKAENRNKSRTKRKTVEEDDIAAAVERSAAELEKLRTELVDAREALRVAGEALAEAELAAREEGTRRGMAEAKVQSLQVRGGRQKSSQDDISGVSGGGSEPL